MKRASPFDGLSDSDESYDDRHAASSSSHTDTSSAGGKAKRTRSRKHLSCEPCRQRRVKCDRKSTCSNCTLHGLSCYWHDAAPTKASDSDTIRQLQEEVAQLHQLIRILTTPPASPPTIPSNLPPTATSAPAPSFLSSIVRNEPPPPTTQPLPAHFLSYFTPIPGCDSSILPPLSNAASTGSQSFNPFQNLVKELTPASLSNTFASSSLLPHQLVSGGSAVMNVNDFWHVGY